MADLKIIDQVQISLSILFLSSVDAETLHEEWQKVKGLELNFNFDMLLLYH